MNEFFATPSLEGANTGELAAAGMSIDESEPSALDLSDADADADADQAEGESLLGSLLGDDE